MEAAKLGQQLPHVLSPAARGGLVGHAGHPLDQARFEQGAYAHQHATHRAVAANPIFAASSHGLVDDRQIDRIQNNDSVFFHAQRGRRIDPVPLPARSAQLGEDFGGVVAALGADDDVAPLERIDIEGVLQCGFVLGQVRGLTAGIRCGEKQWLDQTEVALGMHSVHQHRANHSAPADQTNQMSCFHDTAPSDVCE